MKNKKAILIIAGIIFFINLLRLTDTLDVYRISGLLMEPSYSDGTMMIISNWKSLAYRDVIAFQAMSLPNEGLGKPQQKQAYVGRVVGKGGDQIELRDGRVWLNGRFAEAGVELKFLYRIEGKDKKVNDALAAKLKPTDFVPYKQAAQMIYLRDGLREEAKMELSLFDSPIRESDSLPHRALIDTSWTMNNYGPLTIPEGHLFILGDNRHNALDSRYRGFVPEAAVKGVLIGTY